MDDKRKISQRVAASIAAEIASGRYFPGDRMPSERELALQFGVSRIALREATVTLESQGLIEIRHGSGIWVAAVEPVAEPAGEVRPVADDEAGAIELIEAQRMVESEVAALAANLATADDIVELERLVLAIDDEDHGKGKAADRAFHVKLAGITGNGALISMVEQLWEWRYRHDSLHGLVAQGADCGPPSRADEHDLIVEAVKNRSPTAARKAMQGHLDQVLECVLTASEVREMENLKRQHSQRRKAAGRRPI